MHFAVKRAFESNDDAVFRYELPSWAGLVFLADFLILIPIFIVVSCPPFVPGFSSA